MSNKKLQFDINNTSKEWFKPKIDKKVLKELCRRSDWPGWRHIIIFFTSIIFFGILTTYTWGTWWFLLFYWPYCVLYNASDPIWHECGHRTAFKTRKLNVFFYYIGSFMNNFEPIRWRWSHSLHHSYTASFVDPHDYEVDGSIFAQFSLFNFLLIFVPGIGLLSIHKSSSLHREILLHALGVKTSVMRECIPEGQQGKCIFVSRIFVSIWVLIILSSLFFMTFLPIFLFLIPKFFGNLHAVWGITQHIGLQENIKDHRYTTRSIRLNPIFSFLYWKMEYHIEHHMFPMVPSYNLPKLHEVIKDQLPAPKKGLLDAYKEIIPAVIKKSNDPNYFIPVKVPS